MSTGYSGTPLAKKLSLKDGMRVAFPGMPDSVRTEIDAWGLTLFEVPADDGDIDCLHVFTAERAVLAAALASGRQQIAQNGMIWASWPKKASKVPTDITEDTIRELCLPMGLVDVKVCAVDAVWSGLKLVTRRELRT